MLMIIIVTCLVTVLALIISSALYLISLICNESDDGEATDSLAIDTRDFTLTPTASPLADSNPKCENKDHHHLCNNGEESDGAETLTSEALTSSATKSSEDTGKQKRSSPVTKSPAKPDDQKRQQQEQETIDAQISTWTTTLAGQKTIITNLLGSPISKQVFDDFDAKEIQLGGTGLHWSKTRKSIDRLIKIGIPLDIVNKRQETALHVAVRRKKLPVLIGLICYGAQVDCRNDQEETPLLLACKLNDIFACQLLLVFDANVDIPDKYGLTPRHYSAAICDKHKVQTVPNQPNAAHLILAMLNEMGAKRCPGEQLHLHLDQTDLMVASARSIQSPCTDGCSHSGSYDGNSYNRWPDYKKESLYKRHMFSDILDSKRKETKTGSSMQNKKISRLFCIDGGGMRGVIVCQILIEMEKYLKRPMIDYFDWVGGTSVGAFLACALCTGTTLRHLRRISFDVKDEVFSGTKPYKSKFLERVLKRTFGSTTRMSDVKNKKLAVTTVIADRDPCQLRLFKNYRSPGDILEHYGYAADMFDIMSGQSIVKQTSIGPNFSTKISSSSQSVKNSTSKSNTSLTSSGNYSTSYSNNLKDSSLKQVTSSTNRAQTAVMTTTNTKHATKQVVLPQQRHHSKDDDDSSLNEDDQKERPKKDGGKNEPSNENVIDESEQDPLMWQAVRASGAAPFFFKPYGPYLDGGIISNNPTLDMLTEFFTYERAKSFLRNRIYNNRTKHNKGLIKTSVRNDNNLLDVHDELPCELNLVVSLGTGRGRIIGQQAMIDFGNVASGLATVFSPVELLRSIRAARDLFKKLMHRSCMTDDHILDRAQAWCSSLDIPYFRLNPPLATIFSIDDKRDEQLINALWQTKLYMRAMDPQLKQLAELLDNNNKF